MEGSAGDQGGGRAEAPRERGPVDYEIWEELGGDALDRVLAEIKGGREDPPGQTGDERAATPAAIVDAGLVSRVAVYRGTVEAADRDAAVWAYLDEYPKLKKQALDAGRDAAASQGDGPAVVGPRLAATPPHGARGGLTFRELLLEPPPQDAYRRVAR